jgi:hypothetical protein
MSHSAEISFFMASSQLIAPHARETSGRLAPAAHFAKFESRRIDRLARSIGDLQDIVRTVQARGAIPRGDRAAGRRQPRAGVDLDDVPAGTARDRTQFPFLVFSGLAVRLFTGKKVVLCSLINRGCRNENNLAFRRRDRRRRRDCGYGRD